MKALWLFNCLNFLKAHIHFQSFWFFRYVNLHPYVADCSAARKQMQANAQTVERANSVWGGATLTTPA